MKVIGFSNKYYTLWEVSEHIEENRYGKYKVVNYAYLKNVSFDIDKVKEKYPNTPINTALKGHTSWRTSECLERYSLDEFQGGKYRGEKIENCTDYGYLAWAYDLGYIIDYDSRPLVLSILEKAGYRKINDTHIATPEEVEKIENSFIETEEMMTRIDNGETITIEVKSNLSEEGTIKVGNIEFTWKPENYKELEYNGFYYGLPLDNKGKAKRIKGKTLKLTVDSYELNISEYGWGATLSVIVKDFEIVK